MPFINRDDQESLKTLVIQAIDAFPVSLGKPDGSLEHADFDDYVGDAKTIAEIKVEALFEEIGGGFVGEFSADESPHRFYINSLLYFKYILKDSGEVLSDQFFTDEVRVASGRYLTEFHPVKAQDARWRLLVGLCLILLTGYDSEFFLQLLPVFCSDDPTWRPLD